MFPKWIATNDADLVYTLTLARDKYLLLHEAIDHVLGEVEDAIVVGVLPPSHMAALFTLRSMLKAMPVPKDISEEEVEKIADMVVISMKVEEGRN